MNSPTHAAVSQRAHHNWQQSGSPPERDVEFWLEAERQLTAGTSKEKPSIKERITADAAAESTVEFHLSPAPPDNEAIRAAMQRKEARAPIAPHHTGPKAKPVESGKPLWSKPHSS